MEQKLTNETDNIHNISAPSGSTLSSVSGETTDKSARSSSSKSNSSFNNICTNGELLKESNNEVVVGVDGIVASFAPFKLAEVMVRDKRCLEAFEQAIKQNKHLFHDKTVLDIGCGVGLLSMFAAKAGATRVIGIESSAAVATETRAIVKENRLHHIITIVNGQVEEIGQLPHGIKKADIIISQWMGNCLFYDGSNIDAVLFARDKWLVQDGIIFPDRCSLYIADIEDRKYKEAAINWWQNVYGYDMSCIGNVAIREPSFDIVDPRQVVTKPCLVFTVDLNTFTKKDALSIKQEFRLTALSKDEVQALMTYFVVQFSKCHKQQEFSTSPEYSSTSWKQTVFYLNKFATMKEGEELTGTFEIHENPRNRNEMSVEISVQFNGELSCLHEANTYKYHLQ